MNPKIYNGPDEMESPHSRLWAYLKDRRAQFAALGPAVRFEKGAVVAPDGVVPTCCYYVLEGRVMAFEYTARSGDRYYNFNEKGSLIMEANVLLQEAPPVSFVALSPSILISISRETLLREIQNEPNLAMDVSRNLSSKFLAAMDQVREASQCSVNWKVCNLLLTFSDRYGVDYDGKLLIKEKISQQMLANLPGVNRITMVHTVKELRELDLIEQVNGFYCIRNKKMMISYMEHLDDAL